MFGFVNIFKSDSVSKTIAEVVKSEARAQNVKKLAKPHRNLVEGREISISMRTDNELIMTEIPLGKD
jgi:hypothetical protein